MMLQTHFGTDLDKISVISFRPYNVLVTFFEWNMGDAYVIDACQRTSQTRIHDIACKQVAELHRQRLQHITQFDSLWASNHET